MDEQVITLLRKVDEAFRNGRVVFASEFDRLALDAAFQQGVVGYFETVHSRTVVVTERGLSALNKATDADLRRMTASAGE